MNKQLRFVILLLFVTVAGMRISQAQSAFASEEALKQQASKLFEEDEFEEAYPLYSQLASLYPKDPNYNYRLGVCMLYASDDKEKPVPFLEYASKSPEVEKEVLFYLAKAYHLNYRFDDAITKYIEYEKVASESKSNKLQVERQIEMCRNGKKLLRNITDLLVLDKKELSRADFYRAYDISDIGGKLLMKPDEEAFKTSLDKKKKEKSIIYLATNNNQVFFSSYGDDLSHGKDIYIIRKLPNGDWSKPQTLGYPVNTEYDEDFPFLHPNGKVLYFCSKGHNSMGGYDIFKTTLNEETNTWNKPVNLDFPINTPDDDILYVTNDDEKEAFFSSARSSKTGKTAVYHINVERRPIDVAIIKGAVVKNRENQALDVKITVKDLGDNTILGIYNSKAETGGYLINLPNGGRFMYTVEATGFNTQSEVVVLPTQYEFKPLKQEISYEVGTDKLIVKNLFDEPVDDQSYLLALNFIREKSKLDAGPELAAGANTKPVAKTDNTIVEDTSSPATAKTNDAGTTSTEATTAAAKTKTPESKTAKTAPTGNLSNDAIVKIAYDDAKDAQKEAKELQEQADIALNMANQKNELAQDKMKEATQLAADANNMTDNIKKQTAFDESNQARIDAEALNQETVAAFNIAKKLSLKAAAKDEEADLSMQYAKDLEAAVKSKNPTEALAKLEEQEKKLEELSEKNGNAEPDNIAAGLKIDADNKKRELDKAVRASEDIKQDIADNETLIGTLQADADKTKKDDLKKGLLEQIEGLKADNEQSRKDLEMNEQKVAKVQKEYNGIKNEMALVSNVVDKSKTGSNEDAAASVATIDKTKLEQQVNEIKNNSDNAVVTSAKTEPKATADVVVTGTERERETQREKERETERERKAETGTEKGVTASDNTITETVANTQDYRQQYADQLIIAANATTQLERETKKAEVYKDWAAAISTEIAEKKEALKMEKDKTKKKELSTAVTALEKELKEKQQEEKTSIASAEKLKKEQAVRADNTAKTTKTTTPADNAVSDHSTTTTTTADNRVTPDNTSTSDNTAGSAVPTIAAVNTAHNDQLADAEKIRDAAAREKAKADVLNDWSKAIDATIEKQKQDMAASGDPEMKALLAKKISDAEALSKEKKELATASLTKAQNLQAGTVAVTETSKPATETSKPVSDNPGTKNTDAASTETVKSTTDNAISTTDPGTRDNTKPATDHTIAKTTEAVKTTDAATTPGNTTPDNTTTTTQATTSTTGAGATTNATETPDNSATTTALTLVQKLDAAVAAAEKATTETERENKKKEAYAAYVADATTQLEEKQSALKTEKNKTRKKELTQEIAALESGIKEKQELQDAAVARLTALEEQKPTTADNAVKLTDAGAENTKIIAVSEYNNAAAIDKASKAAVADKEAEKLDTQAHDLKEQAAEKTKASEKEALFAQAAELSKQADAKRTEALQLSTEANKTEYTANRDVLDQLAAASGSKTSDDISMAEMMKDESKLYFEKAEKSRTLAAEASSDYDKLAALEDAAANDKIALEKQKKATELYKKSNPAFVANTGTTVTKSTAGDNSTTKPTPATGPDHIVKTSESTQSTSPDNSVKTTDVAVTEPVKPTPVTTESTQSTSPDNSVKTSDVAVTEPVKSTPVTTESTQSTSPDNSVKTTDVVVTEPVKSTPVTTGSTQSTSPDNSVKPTDVAVTEPVRSTDAATTETVKPASDNTITSTTPEVKTTDAATESKTAPATTSVTLPVTEKFVRTTQPVYSAAKPIPVNEKLPEGLIYKVQIGAFRNPIAPEQFSGMSPLTAETTPQGLTRYTAGLFTKFSTADKVKEEIRSLGYRDAFVVAFLNGKRIPISEASKLSGEQGAVAASSTPTATKTADAATTNTTDNVNATAVKTTSANTNTASAKEIAPAENVATVGGLFYTVQVGVYSQPITSAKLYNIQPLYTEKTANGYLRYNTGIYNNTSRANEAREIVVRAGVKDAFVTAYYQGKRITLPQAAEIEKQGSAVFSTAPNMNVLPTVGGRGVTEREVEGRRTTERETERERGREVKTERERETERGREVKTERETERERGREVKTERETETERGRETERRRETTAAEKTNPEPVVTNTPPVVTEQPAATTELRSTVDQNNTMPADPGLVYKVQIGAFKDEVPLEIANQFIKIAGKGIKNYKDANGLTIYTLGSFKTYEEASQLKSEIVATVKDAFIVAYNDGKKISIDEAKTLQTK